MTTHPAPSCFRQNRICHKHAQRHASAPAQTTRRSPYPKATYEPQSVISPPCVGLVFAPSKTHFKPIPNPFHPLTPSAERAMRHEQRRQSPPVGFLDPHPNQGEFATLGPEPQSGQHPRIPTAVPFATVPLLPRQAPSSIESSRSFG